MEKNTKINQKKQRIWINLAFAIVGILVLLVGLNNAIPFASKKEGQEESKRVISQFESKLDKSEIYHLDYKKVIQSTPLGIRSQSLLDCNDFKKYTDCTSYTNKIPSLDKELKIFFLVELPEAIEEVDLTSRLDSKFPEGSINAYNLADNIAIFFDSNNPTENLKYRNSLLQDYNDGEERSSEVLNVTEDAIKYIKEENNNSIIDINNSFYSSSDFGGIGVEFDDEIWSLDEKDEELVLSNIRLRKLDKSNQLSIKELSSKNELDQIEIVNTTQYKSWYFHEVKDGGYYISPSQNIAFFSQSQNFVINPSGRYDREDPISLYIFTPNNDQDLRNLLDGVLFVNIGESEEDILNNLQ